MSDWREKVARIEKSYRLGLNRNRIRSNKVLQNPTQAWLEDDMLGVEDFALNQVTLVLNREDWISLQL
jgi:hypothetical protein